MAYFANGSTVNRSRTMTRPTDDEIRKRHEEYPAPWRLGVGAIVDRNGKRVIFIDEDRTQANVAFVDNLCIDAFNARARELGLMGEAHEIHAEHPFPWHPARPGGVPGMLFDANGSAVQAVHFAVKVIHAEARRQGVRFEGGDE